MIDLTFVGNGIMPTGPYPDNIIGHLVGPLNGNFMYQPYAPGGTIGSPISLVDGLYNSNAQLIGSVAIPLASDVNGTLGSFFFYTNRFPNLYNPVFVSNVGLYNDPVGAPASGVPEASTWVMCLMGLALLAYAAMRRPKSLEVRASPRRLRSELLSG